MILAEVVATPSKFLFRQLLKKLLSNWMGWKN